MTKIAIVGAGSLVFTRTVVSDLLQQEATVGCEIHLVDVDADRLRAAEQAVLQLGARAGRKLSVLATVDLRQGVSGSDYVINTIQVGGRAATLIDFELPEKHGVRQTIADTHGIGGISRAMRTIPAVLEIARTVAEAAPRAVLLNYTNPMAMVVMALDRAAPLPHVGLCHGTEHTISAAAGYLQIERSAIAWQAAGINHMTWVLALSASGRDLYPALRAYGREADLSTHDDAVRLELLRRFGYYVSESSVHNAEYYPWFLRAGVDPPKGVRVREYLYRLDDLERDFAAEAAVAASLASAPLPPQSEEYAPRVIAALEANETYRFMGNVSNSPGLVTNLPSDCCVEIPCFADGGAIVPGAPGRLPEACAALNRAPVEVQLLTVQGILERRKEAIYQAALIDPLLSAQLTIDETVTLVDELIEAHGDPARLC